MPENFKGKKAKKDGFTANVRSNGGGSCSESAWFKRQF